MPEPRYDHASVMLGGLIYIIGGSDQHGNGLSSVVRLDPASGVWDDTKASMSTTRSSLTAFVLDGHIYAAGGDGEFTALCSVERYDAEADSWSPVAAMSTARFYAFAAVVGEAGGGGDVDLFESLISKATRARR